MSSAPPPCHFVGSFGRLVDWLVIHFGRFYFGSFFSLWWLWRRGKVQKKIDAAALLPKKKHKKRNKGYPWEKRHRFLYARGGHEALSFFVCLSVCRPVESRLIHANDL